jgi:hypothetical protein
MNAEFRGTGCYVAWNAKLKGRLYRLSAVSFLVQLVFPWELENFGSSVTFLLYGLFAIVGLVVVMRILPETKGKSLEELEAELVHP